MSDLSVFMLGLVLIVAMLVYGNYGRIKLKGNLHNVGELELDCQKVASYGDETHTS